jgi:hypothetical protein
LVVGAGASTSGSAARADTGLDVRRTGLPPLLQALEAAANCTGLSVDSGRFRHAMAQYRLSPEDLTPYGRFPGEVTDLSATYRRQVLDDRLAFCSAARLQFAVKNGILDDLDR